MTEKKNLITKEKQRYYTEYDTFYMFWYSFFFGIVHRCKFLDWLHPVHNKFCHVVLLRQTNWWKIQASSQADAIIAVTAAAVNAKVKKIQVLKNFAVSLAFNGSFESSIVLLV